MKKINQTAAILFVFILLVNVVVMAKDSKKVDLKVSGMTCKSCVESVKSALMKVDGVKKADVNLKDGKAVVEFDSEKADQTKLIAAITGAGFKAEDNKANTKVEKSNKSGCCSDGQKSDKSGCSSDAQKSEKSGCCGDAKKSGCGSDKKDKSSGEKI